MISRRLLTNGGQTLRPEVTIFSELRVILLTKVVNYGFINVMSSKKIF